MRIHALTTGVVKLKRSFLFASGGWRRQLDLFLPGEWCDPVPIHCWAVEHEDQLWLVDTGETAWVRDIPFARFAVGCGDELPHVLEAAGLSLADVSNVVLTHMHGDHMDGAIHVSGSVLVHEPELEFSRTLAARTMQRLLRQPIPPRVDFRPLVLDGGPFGGFAESRPLTDDGRIVAVSTPGHTPGHISVICIDDEGRHVMLAGDTTDTIEQLRSLRADAVSPKPAVTLDTMRRIIEHGRRHPTVYLPAHDPDSVGRLAGGVVL